MNFNLFNYILDQIINFCGVEVHTSPVIEFFKSMCFFMFYLINLLNTYYHGFDFMQPLEWLSDALFGSPQAGFFSSNSSLPDPLSGGPEKGWPEPPKMTLWEKLLYLWDEGPFALMLFSIYFILLLSIYSLTLSSLVLIWVCGFIFKFMLLSIWLTYKIYTVFFGFIFGIASWLFWTAVTGLQGLQWLGSDMFSLIKPQLAHAYYYIASLGLVEEMLLDVRLIFFYTLWLLIGLFSIQSYAKITTAMMNVISTVLEPTRLATVVVLEKILLVFLLIITLPLAYFLYPFVALALELGVEIFRTSTEPVSKVLVTQIVNESIVFIGLLMFFLAISKFLYFFAYFICMRLLYALLNITIEGFPLLRYTRKVLLDTFLQPVHAIFLLMAFILHLLIVNANIMLQWVFKVTQWYNQGDLLISIEQLKTLWILLYELPNALSTYCLETYRWSLAAPWFENFDRFTFFYAVLERNLTHYFADPCFPGPIGFFVSSLMHYQLDIFGLLLTSVILLMFLRVFIATLFSFLRFQYVYRVAFVLLETKRALRLGGKSYDTIRNSLFIKSNDTSKALSIRGETARIEQVPDPRRYLKPEEWQRLDNDPRLLEHFAKDPFFYRPSDYLLHISRFLRDRHYWLNRLGLFPRKDITYGVEYYPLFERSPSVTRLIAFEKSVHLRLGSGNLTGPFRLLFRAIHSILTFGFTIFCYFPLVFWSLFYHMLAHAFRVIKDYVVRGWRYLRFTFIKKL